MKETRKTKNGFVAENLVYLPAIPDNISKFNCAFNIFYSVKQPMIVLVSGSNSLLVALGGGKWIQVTC